MSNQPNVKFIGWKRYTNTGVSFREWEFPLGVTVKGLVYPRKAILQDRGFDTVSPSRFRISVLTEDATSYDTVARFDDETTAAEVLGFPCPAWPASADLLACIEQSGQAHKALTEIGAIVSGVQKPAEPASVERGTLEWAKQLDIGLAYAAASVGRIRTGDIIGCYGGQRRPGFVSIPLSVEEMQALRDIEPAKFAKMFIPLDDARNSLAGLWSFVRNKKKWGLRAKVFTPTLYILRLPPVEQPNPICASSDDAAIFELLSEVGGRLTNPNGA